MSAQPRHPGHHMAGQMRRARQLRKDAELVLADKFGLLHDIVRRVDDLMRDGATGEDAWTDFHVEAGLETIGAIERIYAKLIADAEWYDSRMQDIGA